MTNKQHTTNAEHTRQVLDMIRDAENRVLCLDMAEDLEQYEDDLHDAISEIADNWTSIYTAERIAYALENPESARDAIAECLAMDPREFFARDKNADFDSYLAHLGGVAQYLDIERAIYNELEDVLRLAVINRVYGAGYRFITEAQAQALEALDYSSADDLGELYAEALEILDAVA